jgi:hypothetical protein
MAADKKIRRAHPQAWAMFKTLRDLPVNDRLFVYRALTSRLSAAPERLPERGQVAMNALQVCMDDLKAAPSKRDYEGWRAAQPRPEEWPSSTTIRNTFEHSWAKALDALGVAPKPEVLARRLLDINSSYERDELLAAIHCWVEHEEPGRLTFVAYSDWARRMVGRSDRPLSRIPLSMHPFSRSFGSWRAAIAAAGHLDYLTSSSAAGRPGLPGGTYGDEQITQAIRHAAAALPGRDVTLTAKRYADWRRKKIDAATTRGETCFLPSPEVIITHMGSWADALAGAGLISEAEARLRPRHGAPPLSDERVLGDLVDALRETGPTVSLSKTRYRRWRRRRLLDAERDAERPASDALICLRFGSWEHALAKAQAILGDEPEGASDG